MCTRKGTVKKTELAAFSNPRAGGIIAIGIDEGDAVMSVQLSDGKSEIVIGTRDGMAIRFPEDDIRAMGRTSLRREAASSLRDDDEVVGMEVLRGRRNHPHRHGERLRQADRDRRVPRAERAAASASSTSRRASATARSSASRASSKTRS